MKHVVAAAACVLAVSCVSAEPPPPSPPMVSVFTVAHQDDWQLFMNPAAYRAMDEKQEKAVFVHLTAGDAGAGIGGEPVPYYLAREEGALRAVRFMANAADPEVGKGVDMHSEKAIRAGHQIQRYAYANAVVYFLRLHDGFIVNDGVFTPHDQSLERLRTNAVASIEAIDASTRYNGWDDLTGALAAIVEAERVAGSGLALHIAETDVKRNPGDHPDHKNTAMAMETVAGRFACASITRHDEYATKERSVNLKGKDLMIDIGTWAATASGLSDNHAQATWEDEHNAWIGRSYSRSTPATGACNVGPAA